MDTSLGKFEGHKVEAARLSLTKAQTTQVGKIADGELVYFMGMAKVSKISHGRITIGNGELYARLQEGGVSRLVVLDAADGERMLDEAIMLADEKFGVRDLFHQEPDEPPAPADDPDAPDAPEDETQEGDPE
jgi:hypothetical protein